MDSSSLKGIELGKLVLSSGLLHSSWSKISWAHQTTHPSQASGLGIKKYEEAKHTLVVFNAPPISASSSSASSTLLSGSQNHNPFHFLCSEIKSSFSLHTPAFQLFSAACKDLSEFKSELLESKKPVILTGAALGGAVASLFTLWLLETIDPKQKRPRPLCITFGSPFIGDASLQQMLENSVRNSCFLHVIDDAAQPPIAAGFKPFGTFLICFDSECICIEDPEAVVELLTGADTDIVDWRDYSEVLDGLEISSMSDSRLVIDGAIITRMEERAAKKKQRFDQLKKLNDMKILMMYIEWYKKTSKKNKMGYYDRFKSGIASQFDENVKKYKRELNDYWKSMVKEVEKKPQSEKSILKTRCLLSGNNYRRLMEPLDIAEYYLGGKRNYRTVARVDEYRHYVMLEKWFKEDDSIKASRWEGRDLSDLLTFDSCFWAEVEEAMIAIKEVKTQGDEESMGKLVRFEEYVWEMIRKREVSPEIFLEESSFMKWWRAYKEIKGSNSSPSHLTEFMNTGRYQSYGQVCYYPLSNS